MWKDALHYTPHRKEREPLPFGSSKETFPKRKLMRKDALRYTPHRKQRDTLALRSHFSRHATTYLEYKKRPKAAVQEFFADQRKAAELSIKVLYRVQVIAVIVFPLFTIDSSYKGGMNTLYYKRTRLKAGKPPKGLNATTQPSLY